MPTVFISYSHDSLQHADRVLALADRLIEEGIDCILDQYEEAPPEGWPKWMDRQVENVDFILVVCTETYHKRVMGTEEKGKGLGVRWESTLAYQKLYDSGGENTQIIPILFDDCKIEHIPTPLRGTTYYFVHTNSGYEDLYRRLTHQPKITKPKAGKLKKLPFRERKQDFQQSSTEKTTELKSKQQKKTPSLFRNKSETLSDTQAKAMLIKHGLFDSSWNKVAIGIKHEYLLKHEGKVVYDKTSNLMWQQSGSIKHMLYRDAEAYIAKLNHEKYCGYSDWQPPTLEEAMSLMEHERKNGDLHIDPVFDKIQRWIWTADFSSADRAWFVHFFDGLCSRDHLDGSSYYVRAVRSG